MWEEILLSQGLMTLNLVLSQPQYSALRSKMKPQLDEVATALQSAGFGQAAAGVTGVTGL